MLIFSRDKVRGYNATKIPLTEKQKKALDGDVMKILENGYTDTRIAPLMALDDELARFPKTYILVCEYDSLRDDGVSC